MAFKPKLYIEPYHGDGKYDYSVFRTDRIRPICSGVSMAHAEHIVKILKPLPELPEKFSPIAEWMQYDTPLTDDDIKRLGLTVIGDNF